jgi:hypothetical protein
MLRKFTASCANERTPIDVAGVGDALAQLKIDAFYLSDVNISNV